MNKVVIPIVAAVGLASLLMLYLAGAGFRNGTFELGQAFTLLRYCAYGGITGVGLTIFIIIWERPAGISLLVLFFSALAGLAAFYLPYRQQQIAARVPPIHDITTNIDNPPAFVAIVPIRAGAPNPPEYLGGETAELQREYYPDMMSQVYVQPPEAVFTAVTEVVVDMGWELVDANVTDGRIEATDTTVWFGFKDDIVIRLDAGLANSTVLDVRSKSRIGRSDIGTNARRIRAFIAALNEKLMVGN